MTVRTDIRFDVSQGRAQVYSEDGNLWNKLMRKCLVLWCSRTDKCRLNCCLLSSASLDSLNNAGIFQTVSLSVDQSGGAC